MDQAQVHKSSKLFLILCSYSLIFKGFFITYMFNHYNYLFYIFFIDVFARQLFCTVVSIHDIQLRLCSYILFT